MKTLPIVLHNKKILLIGAGKVALQKAKVLHNNNIDFEVLAQDITTDIEEFTSKLTQKKFESSDLQDYQIVIDATGNKNVTTLLLELKKQKNLLLNVVDVPELCDFYFASLVQYGPLKIAVSSGGASPTITQVVRDKIKSMLPHELEQLTEEKLQLRKQNIIEPQKTKEQTQKLLGKVYLVGCGTGDVELLTLKAYRIIQSVDVVFIDHLIADEILEIIPKETKRVFVGKQKGFHSVKQEAINELLLEHAQQGLSIARLKSGDPYIFGRGSEEAISMVENNIQVEVIPGISSAIAAPLLSGIAPTARGYATNLSIVSAHLAGNRVNLEWIPLLKYTNHTIVVLMGVSRAKEIKECAIKIGADLDKDVAVISNASRKNQSVKIGTLANLEEICENAERPALLVFGDVVNLHSILPKYGEIL
ncbi:uroporphyrinogen-III C-methyltransferase [Sulfurimonas sp. C5]|uniref:uroporphyrinogen-III C-methyltransferase n=1 Tax=Sulfurimonas sp. C5 TaxID=3036947 RepID=UPI00245613CA|nr:uroporphyrinogen-III C-methyltransferase [Sulfurimonas sp. C5]MDH4944172.1 uroporphyrinogen-III C-methyltransferase [Sulfurimonas sp. C5]